LLVSGVTETSLFFEEKCAVITTTEVYDAAALTALIAAATVLGTDVKAGLFVNDITPSKVLAIADLTEPTYASYVRQAVVMGSPARDPVQGIVSLAAALTWQETGTVTPVIVKGIFYTYGTGPALLAVEVFQNAIALNDHLDFFTSILQYIQSNENAGLTTILR
jgi:hypothetical protein